MTKKGSFFNQFLQYLKNHPAATIAWIWSVSFPLLGSLWLAGNYQSILEKEPATLLDFALLGLLASSIMGLAFLPTTLTAVFIGFWLGWDGFIWFIAAYSLANVLGYAVGKYLNLDFLDFLSEKSPDFYQKLESKKGNWGALIFFIRISPVIPFAISNLLFASLQVPLRKVLIYGIPGMLPRTIMAFLAGIVASDFMEAKNNLQEPWQIILLIFLLIISIWGIWINWKKSKS
ncbi:TVP38/TMEM64 family protein [Algoriphagus limi]|uniref:VTT domain-containing protein n=1 Tax=Algoriphagus limi TaxID=2975273 RepID=A0ABT2G4H2_9BACT|nr:VTT domain-containing protein [Algoriphagus limi]MCS5490159.1 VTT domain-containing protein [Algoriphagus limi]